MRFGYPIAATEENWLHETFVAAVTRIHQILDDGGTIPDWLEILPADRREALKSKHGLKKKLKKYESAARGLSKVQRRAVLDALEHQNNLPALLASLTHCECITELPEKIREPATALFTAGFDLLNPLGIRDRHYMAIWDALPSNVCPFCCQEPLEEPTLPREDLDHYLSKSDYPFAAVNLKNLVPMGKKCNQNYKGMTNILLDPAGNRRKSFDAYVVREVGFNLANSVPFEGEDERNPRWQIDFEPDSEECVTWDAVFRVRERFRKNILDRSFNGWLEDFARWFARTRGRENLNQPVVTAALKEFAENEAIQGYRATEFLRVLVYKMLHGHCVAESGRLLDHLRWLIKNVPSLA